MVADLGLVLFLAEPSLNLKSKIWQRLTHNSLS